MIDEENRIDQIYLVINDKAKYIFYNARLSTVEKKPILTDYEMISTDTSAIRKHK